MPSPLAALSPLDGRYAKTLDPLRVYFSEQALIAYRIRIELEWLQALAGERAIRELKPFSSRSVGALRRLVKDFSERDAEHIENIEAETNHDVKAIEYWLRSKLGTHREIQSAIEFVHFGCTSEDINNLSYALMLRESRDKVMLPRLDALVDALRALARRHAAVPMLARTHGQPATPTTLGKEMANFAHRLARARDRIAAVSVLGKVNGAVGNYNAHLVAYPDFDWERFSRRFVERLGLEFNAYTTQIEPHDWLAELLDAYARANNILLDLDRDLWGYISLGYFAQKASGARRAVAIRQIAAHPAGRQAAAARAHSGALHGPRGGARPARLKALLFWAALAAAAPVAAHEMVSVTTRPGVTQSFVIL